MKLSWQSETGQLLCRWSEPGEYVPYDPSWLHEDETTVYASVLTTLPDFSAHSPLGSGEWFAPWNSRWSVPRP